MLSNIDFEQVLRDGWRMFTTWIGLLYADHPLLAWGITGVVLLYLLYRLSRAQQRRAEQRAKRVRARERGRRKPAARNKRTSRGRSHRHDHDRDREDDEDKNARRSYRTTRRDKLDDWD